MRDYKLKTLEELDFKAKNVFMRVDFNVPMEKDKITDPRRIEKSLKSIRFILEHGGRLLLSSHFGRPLGKDKSFSLQPVAKYLSNTYGFEVLFVDELEPLVLKELFLSLNKNQILFLENLRFFEGEEKNDPEFAKIFSSLTDIYVGEAFGISHRRHASVDALPSLMEKKAIGFQFEEEIKKLDVIKKGEKKPFVVILGGSKFKDKLPLMEALIDKTDEFLLGGLLSHVFLQARGFKGFDMDRSLVKKASLFIDRLSERGKKLFLPLDHVLEFEDQDKDKTKRILSLDKPDKLKGTYIRDIGLKTRKLYEERIKQAGGIFWNGPLGFFEKKPFDEGSLHIGRAIKDNKKAYRVVGGGHSALVAKRL